MCIRDNVKPEVKKEPEKREPEVKKEEVVIPPVSVVEPTPVAVSYTHLWVTKSVKEGKISLEEGKEFLSNYRSGLYGYTYLE